MGKRKSKANYWNVKKIINTLIDHNIDFNLKIIGKGRTYEEPLKNELKEDYIKDYIFKYK